MTTTDEARTEATRRYPMHATPSTRQELHNAGYQAFVAGWQASRKVEAAPTDTEIIDTFEGYVSNMAETPEIAEHAYQMIAGFKEEQGLRAPRPVQVEVTTDMQRLAGVAAFDIMYPLSGEPEGTPNGDYQRRFAADVARAALTAALGGGDHAE